MQQRCNRVLNRKAESAINNLVSARDEIALVDKKSDAIFAEEWLTLSGVASVSMMKSPDLRNRYNAPAFGLLHCSRLWSVLGQC
jgi:hypothetical protein